MMATALLFDASFSGCISRHITHTQPQSHWAHAGSVHASLSDWWCLQVVDDYASRSFRVLAIACAPLPHVANLDLASMPLQALERCAGHMDLLGLVVMSNHLRADSKDTISHLQDR